MLYCTSSLKKCYETFYIDCAALMFKKHSQLLIMYIFFLVHIKHVSITRLNTDKSVNNDTYCVRQSSMSVNLSGRLIERFWESEQSICSEGWGSRPCPTTEGCYRPRPAAFAPKLTQPKALHANDRHLGDIRR